ncbi:hypothetical protein GWK47_039101 [Chionoecetes opilio]|uniref:Uncharacterized protein n=1 Tax=Chionoecetes opilio TaxID=41210 RepID=A0A8J4YKB0_CHIOP|nr:hypothetical protein GWK47_039101 [Chionoecetes opilio]
MEDQEGQEPCYHNKYHIIHFFRNVCSPILGELLAKELKNCDYIKEQLSKDQCGTLSKTLHRVLKSVSSRGKNQAARKRKPETENCGLTKTQHLNNLDDNETLLNEIKISDLVHECEEDVKVKAVRNLGELNVTLLLNILTNDVLKFPLADLEDHLNNLKDGRNCIFHKDNYNKRDKLKILSEAVESVYKYLGKDIANLQEKIKIYFTSPLSICPSAVMREAQQEINKNYRHHVPRRQHSIQPTIQHLRDSESYTVVENFGKFLKDHKASECRPVLLCGAPGAGKSSFLCSLVHTFTQAEDFLLVVRLHWNKSGKMSKETFWRWVYTSLTDLCPETVQRYELEQVMVVLENYSSEFLFLWDLNLQDSRKQPLHLDHGTWIMSYQGIPENPTNCCVLRVASLCDEQVRQVLNSIDMSKEDNNKVHDMYRTCQYKGLVNTPEMVHIFAHVCVRNENCVPFYKLIQRYIESKIERTEENQVELVKLGQKAFNAIKENRIYYSEQCLANIQSNVSYPFLLENSQSKGRYFQYQVVADCLAAWYIVENPETACALWLQQTPLFRRVFEVVCSLWCEREGGIRCNLHFLRQYLEMFFEISKPKRIRAKKQTCKQAMNVDENNDKDSRAKKEKHEQAMEVDEESKQNTQAVKADKDEKIKAEKQKNNQTIEIDEDTDHRSKAVEVGRGKAESEAKKNNRQAVEDEDEDYTKPNNFLRWIFLSKIAKEHQNNQDILLLLADLLACKNTWLFKCKLLNEATIDNISLVLGHVKMTRELTIRVESGPDVTVLLKLWNMLCSHQGMCCNADVQIVIHHTENNWVGQEKQLAALPSVIARSTAPLHITKYVGPLLCSRTPHFLKCLCMARVKVLVVRVCDLASLREVLACRQDSLESADVTLRLKVEEQELLMSNPTPIPLSPSLPLTLKVIYFERLQRLLDMFQQPDLLSSLIIYRVYMHENFKLDLTHFTKMKSLFIRFLYMGRLPSLSLEAPQSADKMEVNDEDDAKIPLLPLKHWTFQLVMNLLLPANLQRFLMRNLSFCGDSNIHLLCSKYWEGLALQRLCLLGTNISFSKVKNFFNTKIEEDIGKAMKRCRIDVRQASSKSVVKNQRLQKEEREQRRKHKPEGHELIITSEAKLCEDCHHLSCRCPPHQGHQGRDTYEDLVSLVQEVYSYDILNISYSGNGIVMRKDMCGDMQVECPVSFLDDESAEQPEGKPELCQVLKALTLAQCICLSHTQLSHEGALHLINHLKESKNKCGSTEPFRLTIVSRRYHMCSLSPDEVKHCHFTRAIKDDRSLQQFTFKCDCWTRCHYFKKTNDGCIYFNDTKLLAREG